MEGMLLLPLDAFKLSVYILLSYKELYMNIMTNYSELTCEVARACKNCGRNTGDVKILSVSKTVGIEEIILAKSAGATMFGENRIDVLGPKFQLHPEYHWHFIGNIQSRKISEIVKCSELIHSVHKIEHLKKIDKVAKEENKIQNILIECNTSGELSKSGVSEQGLEDMILECMNLDNISVQGLMTMAPIVGSAKVDGDLSKVYSQNDVKECFKNLALLKSKMHDRYKGEFEEGFLSELSMGMSKDWKIAIECGSTIIRVGSAIFN